MSLMFFSCGKARIGIKDNKIFCYMALYMVTAVKWNGWSYERVEN